jgi:uncharacterized alpha-E superfamily protein
MAMLSRVAEHLYWMARYLERTENTARLVNVNGNLVLDLPKHARPGWSSLIDITGSNALFHRHHPNATENQVVKFMLADDDNPGSILSSIRSARENARTIRDIIPREAWEQINELYLKTGANLASGLSAKSRYTFLKQVILGIQQIAGILEGGMSHDAGFEFVRLGFNLERADMTTRIIDVRSSALMQGQTDALKPFENILWMSVLNSLTAYQMYRRHMHAAVRRDAVVKFLLQDALFPRAFHFCLDEVKSCLCRLPRNGKALATLSPLIGQIEKAAPGSLTQSELSQFIDELQIRLGQIHTAIGATYFGASGEQSQSQ